MRDDSADPGEKHSDRYPDTGGNNEEEECECRRGLQHTLVEDAESESEARRRLCCRRKLEALQVKVREDDERRRLSHLPAIAATSASRDEGNCTDCTNCYEGGHRTVEFLTAKYN